MSSGNRTGALRKRSNEMRQHDYGLLSPMNILIFGIVFCVIIVALYVVLFIWQQKRQTELRRRVMRGEPIAVDEFLRNWRVGKRGSGLGYAAMDQPGCYVILTNPVTRENGDVTYEAVYVGQSVHVCSRVRQHFAGHGNGDVYADVRAGEDVRVRIVPCDVREMNDVERDLIAAFHATDSYNRTHGGSRQR